MSRTLEVNWATEQAHIPVRSRFTFMILISWVYSVALSACYEVKLSSPTTQPTPIEVDEAHEVDIRFTLDQGAEWIALRGLALGVSIIERDSGLKVSDLWLDYLIEGSSQPVMQAEDVLSVSEEVEEIQGSTRTSLKSLAPLSLPTGSYTFLFYFKRDALNLSTHEGLPAEAPCPTPISVRSPLAAPQLDPGGGRWSGLISADVTLSIELSAQSCGPGSIRSELIGSIDLPLTLSDAERSSLMIHLTPLDRSDDDPTSSIRPPQMTFPLSSHLSPIVEMVYEARSTGEMGETSASGDDSNEEPNEDPNEESNEDLGMEMNEGESEGIIDDMVDQIPIAERFSFSLNQLPEGRFAAQVFIDSDGDALPTPCDRDRGRGGDEWIGVIASSGSNLTITRGQQLIVEDVWTVTQVTACQGLRVALDTMSEESGQLSGDSVDQPAIFLGQVTLTPELLTALALTPQRRIWLSTRRRAITPYRFVDASPLFTLEQAMISQGRFSVHLPRSAIFEPREIAIWVDDDADRALTPCDDPTQLGADLWWWDGDTEVLSALLDLELNRDLPRTPIMISQRCSSPSSMLELTFDFDFGWPSDVSTRPLVVLIDDLISGELLKFTITDLDEQTLDTITTTQLRLPEGSYAISAYIDQDLNQRFTPCDVSALGDRFHTTNALTTRLSLGEIQRVNLLVEEQRDCAFSSDLEVHLSSNIADTSLSASEIASSMASTVTALDHECASDQVWVELSDLDKLSHPPQTRVISTQCISLESVVESPEDEVSEVVFDSIPPSAVEVRACALMSEQSQERVVEYAIQSTIMNTWPECRVPLYWSAREEISLTQPDVQRVNLRLTPRCGCD